MRRRLLIYLIITQLIICSAIIYAISNKAKILGTSISVNGIDKENLLFSEIDDLKYFYEPEPNSTNVVHLRWKNTNGPQNPIYKINADGLNQTTNFTIEKPPNTFRIMALGDSFTFGENVNTEDNYPSQLQNLLDKKCTGVAFQVFNLGVEGYDIKYVVERYKLRGHKYAPDLLLWFIIDDDLKRINDLLVPRSKEYAKQMKKTGEYQQLVKQGDFFPAWNKAREEIINELGGEGSILNLQQKFLAELNQYYKGKLVAFTFPSMDGEYKNVLRNFANSRDGIFFYDGVPNIYTNEENRLPDTHPSPKGYTEIVSNLFGYLTKNKIIPCD